MRRWCFPIVGIFVATSLGIFILVKTRQPAVEKTTLDLIRIGLTSAQVEGLCGAPHSVPSPSVKTWFAEKMRTDVHFDAHGIVAEIEWRWHFNELNTLDKIRRMLGLPHKRQVYIYRWTRIDENIVTGLR